MVHSRRQKVLVGGLAHRTDEFRPAVAEVQPVSRRVDFLQKWLDPGINPDEFQCSPPPVCWPYSALYALEMTLNSRTVSTPLRTPPAQGSNCFGLE